MKVKNLYSMIAILMLLVLVVPNAASAEGRGGDEVQRPATAMPLQLGPTFTLQGGPTVADSESLQSAPGAPNAAMPEWGTSEGRYTLVDRTNRQPADAMAEAAAQPDALNACTNYIQNAGFEASTAWSLSPVTNVKYSPYGNNSQRSLYMTTANRRTAYLWQTITIPAGSGSIHLSFDAWQNLDPNEGAWVSIFNASNTERWWTQPIRSTRQTWARAYWPLSQASFAGKTINIVIEMWPNNDNTRSDMWLDNFEFLLCDAPPTTPARSGGIDLIVSIHKTVPFADRAKYQEIFEYAADAIYEMTNGKHYLRDVKVYQNWNNWQGAHIHWYDCAWPNATYGGYSPLGAGLLTFADRFTGASTFIPGPPRACVTPIRADFLQERERAGYTLAHELGHFYYGLYDEYARQTGDNGVLYSVMNSQDCATENVSGCGPASARWHWLNFSTALNFRGPNDQWRVYGKSAWQILSQSNTLDPQGTWYNGKPKREFFADLAAAAPRAGEWPTIQLPGESTVARGLLRPINWVPPTSGVSAYSSSPHAGLGAQVDALGVDAESTVTYPQPLILVARLGGQFPVARLTLTTQVRAPDGSQNALTLKDDGVAPDYLADDGKFTAILPYDQNGTYNIQSTFSNAANRAAYTSVGLEDVPWVVGDPIGQSISASAEATVTIGGYTGDDHADQLANATVIFSDNNPVRGQIDRAGDRDMFKSTLGGDGTFVFRLNGFALEMRPRVRFWQSDGQTLIGEWTIDPREGYYYLIRLRGPMGTSFYTEISHAEPTVTQGMYGLSFGTPIGVEGDGWPRNIFLPIIGR